MTVVTTPKKNLMIEMDRILAIRTIIIITSQNNTQSYGKSTQDASLLVGFRRGSTVVQQQLSRYCFFEACERFEYDSGRPLCNDECCKTC